MAFQRRPPPHSHLPDAAKPLDDFDRIARQRLGLPPSANPGPPKTPRRTPSRRGMLPRLLLLALVVAALLITVHGFRSRSMPTPIPITGTLRVSFFDVGQGDSTLIQTSTGRNILVDTGPPSSRGALFADLEMSSVRRLDLLILTHADRDHSGNVDAILQHVPTANVMDNGLDRLSPAYLRMHQELAGALPPGVTPLTGLQVGSSSDLGGGAFIHYLGPVVPFRDPNDNSIILRVSLGAISVLLTGDAGQREIGTLLSREAELQSTVLKVAHHGAASSTSLPLLERVHPRVAVISCGLGNPYNHPSQWVLSALHHRGIQIWRTDLQGTIRFQTNGTTYHILPSRK